LYERQYLDPEPEPLISVYVPTYNRGPILMDRAVPSVLSQTYRNLELVVVCDHCTDSTFDLLGRVGDPRLRFVNLPRRGYRYPPTAENHWLAGPVVPANAGLRLVRGAWIARIDDDDTWTPNHLERLLSCAVSGDFEFVSAQFEEERFGTRKIVDGVRALDPYYTRGEPRANDTSPKIGGTQTWLYRSYLRFFRYNINCWRKSWNRVNDIEISLRMLNAGVRMGFLEEVLACVLPRPGERTVGLEAYQLTAAAKVDHFRFEGDEAGL
jgi:glycosyltransferase involved in cell wall biosynthesis